jgi:hypothetical protein
MTRTPGRECPRREQETTPTSLPITRRVLGGRGGGPGLGGGAGG